jgi:hypothetical protein
VVSIYSLAHLLICGLQPLKVVAQGTVDGAKPAIDIVAVHGLNPWNKKDHAYDTWRKPEGEKGHLWLRDTFPRAQPDARVLLYSYNSAPVFGESKERFVHEANSLLERLSLTRREVNFLVMSEA